MSTLIRFCEQVTGIPVVFIAAVEGKGRIAVMRQVVDTYEKWCLRLPTARLNRWLRKVGFYQLMILFHFFYPRLRWFIVQ